MAEAELIEQLRAQVMSLKSPRNSTPERETNDTLSSGGSSRGRIASNMARMNSTGTARSYIRAPSSNGTVTDQSPIITEGTVVLDVGGVIYKTTRNTLKSVESSYFAQLLDSKRLEECPIFIDRNGEAFGTVLEYLRAYVHRDVENVELPTDSRKLKALKREAAFYRLPELVTLATTALQEQHLEKERKDSDQDSNASVIVQEDDVTVEKELDIVFHSVASSQCHFAEDCVQELVGRVNYSLALKQADGFQIKSSSSDVIFDPTRDLPFYMFVHVTLVRDRRRDSPPISPADRGRQKTSYEMATSTSYTLNRSMNEGGDAVATPKNRREGTAPSPREDASFNGSRFCQSNGLGIVPESVFGAMEYRPDNHRNHRGGFRVRYVDHTDWDYVSESQSASPRGAGYYQPSASMVQRKQSNRNMYTRYPDPATKYDMEDAPPTRGARRDAWVNHTPAA